MVGSFLIGFLTYLLFELYCDVDESNLKTDVKHPNVEDISKDKKRKKKSKSNSDRMTCEICLSDVTSAISAIDGGATSIELCTNRADGGITPFMGLVQEVVSLSRSKDVEIHVLIRPRPGNFVYSSGMSRTTSLQVSTRMKMFPLLRKFCSCQIQSKILHYYPPLQLSLMS
jgi:copper chaperone CopZ